MKLTPWTARPAVERSVVTRRGGKRAEEMEALVRDAGMSPKRETIVHCQAGVRTTTGVFWLALLGWKNVRAYDAAMAEWANRDDTPLVVEEGVAAAT